MCDLSKIKIIKVKDYFVLKKPPKAENKNNENTKCQRGYVKNIKYALFAKDLQPKSGVMIKILRVPPVFNISQIRIENIPLMTCPSYTVLMTRTK